jgi:TolA-binding protein
MLRPSLKFRTFRFFLLLGPLLLLGGCSQEMSFRKFYHNTTAHYNGYFNALTKYNESVKDIRRNHKDDFSETLPVFVYGSQSAAANFYPQFDEVIKKCSNVIQNHDISKWIDDCFLLIGKAYFMKREYFEAIESFQYVYTRWKREPIANDALLWLVRCYIASEQYAKAQGAIDLILSNKNFPKDHKGELQALRAELYLAQQRYDQAVEPLLQVQNYKFSRQQQARFYFILGQIYTKTNPKLAGEQYRKCLSKKPYYEMQFQARMNIARMYDGKNVTAKQAKKQLKKLLKDEKNKDFYDEIYYELALLAFKDRNAEQGIAYMKLSTASSTKNPKQKAKSYLYLAEYFYKKQEFTNAQAYYDSTATVIDKQHPKFKEVQGKKEYLGDLVRNLNTIQEQDSLLALGQLPEAQLNKIIDKAIKEDRKRKDQERFEKESGGMNMPMGGTGNQMGGGDAGGGGGGSSDWYFYNQQAVGRGYSQFLQQWGNRELADNWRRSKKEKAFVESGGGGEDGGFADFDESLDESDPRAKYLARIPRTEEGRKKSKALIQEALFNLGGIYREKLDDYKLSISYYEKLLSKYPGWTKEDEALYRVGLVHELVNNSDKKDMYHSQLVSQYPESPFAKLLSGTEEVSTEAAENEHEAEILYEATYKAFGQGKFQVVIDNTASAVKKHPSSSLLPNFEFLAAMCEGRKGDTTRLRAALTGVVQRYPQHPITELAQEMLDMLDPIKRGELTGAIEKEIFKANPDAPHVFVLAIELRTFSQHKEIQLKLANFNDTNFRNNRLRITNMLYGQQYQLLVVRELPNERKGLEYIQVAREHNELLKGLPAGKYHTFIAAKENFNDMYKNNQLEEYLSFYQKNYNKAQKKP